MSFAAKVRRLLIGEDACRHAEKVDLAIREIEAATRRQTELMERSLQETRQAAQLSQSGVRVAMNSMARIMGAEHGTHRQ